MIKYSGIFYENDYFKYIYNMDKTPPKNMQRSAAIILCIDLQQKPLFRSLSALEIENSSEEEIDAHLSRFEEISKQNPEPLPLQIFDGEAAVARTVRNVIASGVKNVIVMPAFEIYDEVVQALRDVYVQYEDTDVSIYTTLYDTDVIDEINAKGNGSQIELMSFGLLHFSRKVLDMACKSAAENKPANALKATDFDSIMFVHADQVTFLPNHFKRVRSVFEEDTSVDFVTSFAEWRSGIPAIFSLDLIDRVPQIMKETLPGALGAKQRACHTYKSKHAIMSEDKPFGINTPIQSALARGAMPASALTCVKAARRAPSDYEARYIKAQNFPKDPHVKYASDFLEKVDAALAKNPVQKLEEANMWAQRNRADFPLLNTRENAGLAYLDSAATSLQPNCVIDACNEYKTHFTSNIWRGSYPNAIYATTQFQAAREKIAAHINADPRDVIFTTNTTTSLNLVAHSWAAHNLHEGDIILIPCNEHHSNMIIWQQIAHRVGAKVKFIPIKLDGRLDMEEYARLIKEKPKLVCAAHVTNVIGLENPICEMTALAHEARSTFVLDAAQSAPHMKIDVQNLGADFVAFSGHKMHSPTGVGVLWAHPKRVREMVPEIIGGGTISEVSLEGTYFRQSPYAFEPGTPPIEQVIALGAAIDYLNRIGMENVEKHTRAITQYALCVAHALPEIQILGDHSEEDGQTGVLAYTHPTQEGSQISGLLGMMGVAVRSGAHCATHLALSLGIPGSARISFGPYTTKEDIDAWGYAMHVVSEISAPYVPRS